MTQQQQRNENNTDDSTVNNNRVGNHTQENFATLVECPKCGVETRVDTPSVGLATCDEDDCKVRAFVLDETEEDKYG